MIKTNQKTKRPILTMPSVEPVRSLKKEDYSGLIRTALSEDQTSNDITTHAFFSKAKNEMAILLAKEKGILCGKNIFTDVFLALDKKTKVKFKNSDGDLIEAGEIVATITGNIKNILKAERTALNFLSMLSGIATKSFKAAQILKPYGISVLDTRKTIPGYRKLSKYAVYTGGAVNHRLDLAKMGLIKDNHISAAGGINNAITTFRKRSPGFRCEIEVETESQLTEALKEFPDVIMLDNMDKNKLKRCSAKIRKFNLEHGVHILCEASGGYNLNNIISLANTGIDFVSMGCLTNDINPLDFSMEINQSEKNSHR